jgi:hypothetical protein
MSEHRAEPSAGSELPETIDGKKRQSTVIEFLLLRVPVIPEELASFTGWIESGQRRDRDPHGIH